MLRLVIDFDGRATPAISGSGLGKWAVPHARQANYSNSLSPLWERERATRSKLSFRAKFCLSLTHKGRCPLYRLPPEGVRQKHEEDNSFVNRIATAPEPIALSLGNRQTALGAQGVSCTMRLGSSSEYSTFQAFPEISSTLTKVGIGQAFRCHGSEWPMMGHSPV